MSNVIQLRDEKNNEALYPITDASLVIGMPSALADLSEDTTHRVVTDTEKAVWNGKYSKPVNGIPASDLANKYAGSPSAGGPAFKALGIPFGNVDANSTATDIKATVDNFPATLTAGVCAYIRNDIIASASGFTLNINGTGALPVYSTMSDASRATTVFTATSTYLFVYNPTRVEGGCWDIYFGYNSDTNTIGYNLRTNGITAVAAAKFYRYRLLFTSPDGHFLIPSNTSSSTKATAAKTVNQAKIDPFAPIWYYSTTTAIEANAGVSASYLWMQYSAIPLGYAFNRTGAALTMTERYPVYLKCAPQSDGSAIMDADTPIVQALPSTEDGKIYIFLGYAESATNITLYYHHPVYYFKDGAIRQWTNAAAGGGGGEFVLTMVPPTTSYGSSHVGNIDPAITTEAIRAAIADGKQIVLYGQFGDDDDYMRYYLQGTIAPDNGGEAGDITELAFRTQRPYGGVFNGGSSEVTVMIGEPTYYGTDRPVFYFEGATPAISQNIEQDKTATDKTTSPKAVADYVDGKTGDLTDLDTTDKSSLVAAINEAASSGGTNPLPTGGSAGQVLAKASAADYDVEWGNIPSGGGGALPVGGTKGQTLVKQSAIDGDAAWVLQDENKELIIDQTFHFDKLQPTAYDSVTGYYTVDSFPSWVTAGDGGTFRACLNVVLFSNISAVPYPRDSAASICDLTRVDSTHFSIASGQAPSGTPNPAAFFFTPTFNGGITIPRVLNAKTKYRMVVENGASYACYYTPVYITTRAQRDLFTSFPMPLSVYGDIYGPRILQSNWEIEFTLDTTTSTTYIIAHYVKRSAVVRTKASGNPLYFEPMTVGYGDNRYNSWQVGNSGDFYLATNATSIEWVHEGTRVRVYKIG